MKKLELITSGLSVMILVACCVALLIFGLSQTGWKALVIPTGSMRPTIPPGSLVLVHRVPTSSLKIGDVITYINPHEPATTISHRIIKKITIDGSIPGFITKGDANKLPDTPIVAGAVEGRVVWHVPDAGNWLLKSKKPIIILPIVYLAVLLIIIGELFRIRDYLELMQPYRLPGFHEVGNRLNFYKRKVAYATGLTIVFVLISVLSGPVVLALLKSNTVTLVDNSATVAPTVNTCSGNTSNNTSVNVTSDNIQSASSGNATTSGNTNSGSATSGNASNSNSTSVTVDVNDC